MQDQVRSTSLPEARTVSTIATSVATTPAERRRAEINMALNRYESESAKALRAFKTSGDVTLVASELISLALATAAAIEAVEQRWSA